MEVTRSREPDNLINFSLRALSWSPPDLQFSPNIREKIVLALRAGILSGAFLPGDELSESKLCGLFEVSRPSIREAMRYLESEKLITIRRNRRMYVTVINRDEAAAICRLLGLLVSEALANLAHTRSRDAMKLIYDAQAKVSAAAIVAEASEICTAWSHFYGLIMRCSEHLLTAEIVENLCARIGFWRAKAMHSGDRVAASLIELQTMIATLERGDTAQARRASRAHFDIENILISDFLAGNTLR